MACSLFRTNDDEETTIHAAWSIAYLTGACFVCVLNCAEEFFLSQLVEQSPLHRWFTLPGPLRTSQASILIEAAL